MRLTRIFCVLLCAALLLTLCACTQSAQKDDPVTVVPSTQPTNPAQNPAQNPSAGVPTDPEQQEDDPNAAAPGALTEAPMLLVDPYGEALEPMIQVDSWSYTRADGTMVVADLPATETLELPLEEIPQLLTRQETVQLYFSETPDSLLVHSRSEVGWGLSPEPAQEILCDGDILALTLPLEQNQVYEITADWQRESFRGTVRYLFRVSAELAFAIDGGQTVEPEELELPYVNNPQVYPLIVESGDAVRCCLSPGGGEDTVYLEMQQDDSIGMLRLSHFIVNNMDYASALTAAGFFFDTPDTAYAITDLDTEDGFLEIAIQELGSSEDLRTTFFRYDGGLLRCIGRVEGLVFSPSLGWSDITFSGDGTLSSYFRLNVLHTWYAEGKYALNERDWLTLLPEKEYESTRSFPVTVLQQLSLWSEDAMRTGGASDSVALPGQQLTLIGTDNQCWIHALTESGQSCWLKLADTFSLESPEGSLYGGSALEGLCMAD